MSTKPLTLTLITQKAKTEAHYSIKKLNLCANSLDDLSLLERLPNLEVLSLSVNCINSLHDIVKCKNLRELYLRKNNISDPKQLAYLQQLPNLKILWLQENPIADHPNYRELVLSNCQSLENLDDQAVAAPKIVYEETPYEEPKINSNRYQSAPYSKQPITNQVRQSVELQQSQSPQAAIQLQMKQQQEYQQQQLLLKQQQQQQEYQYQQLLLQQQQFQEQQQAAFQKQQQQQIQIQQQSQELSVDRNENILCAVLSLLKELDPNSLAVVQRETDRYLRLFEQ